MSEAWTAHELQLALFWWLEDRSRQKIMANVIPFGWYECDMFSLTGSGYGHELEVKVSRSDFFADFKKEAKHQRLAGNQRGSAVRTFCFACPEGLIDPSEVQDYAGLLYVARRSSVNWQCNWARHLVRVVKKPPVLQAPKMSDIQIQTFDDNIWYKYATAFKSYAKLRTNDR